MAFTIEQYNALTAAIAQGATRVKYADKEIQYNSMDELIRLKALMEKDLGLTKGSIKTSFAKFSTGLNNC